MCWSLGVAAFLSIASFFISIRMALRGDSKYFWIPLFFFGIMEALQALSYSIIGQCGLPQNQLLTSLSYLHIVFQPLAINAVALYFVSVDFRNKIRMWVFGICAIAGVIMLLKLFPFAWAGSCGGTAWFCGERLCTIEGNWHLGWTLPLNGLPFAGLAYGLSVFVLPLLYGSWRVVFIFLVPSYLIAHQTTTNPYEAPAIWCLLAVVLIVIASLPSLRERLHHNNFYFSKYPLIKSKNRYRKK